MDKRLFLPIILFSSAAVLSGCSSEDGSAEPSPTPSPMPTQAPTAEVSPTTDPVAEPSPSILPPLDLTISQIPTIRLLDQGQMQAALGFSSEQQVSFDIVNQADLPLGVAADVDDQGLLTLSYDGNQSQEFSLLVQVSVGQQAVRVPVPVSIQTDPLYSQQWHLRNLGQHAFSQMAATPGFDLNMGDLLARGFDGRTVKVMVNDSGLEIGHPDLRDNILPGRSFNFLNYTSDPTPAEIWGDHGTSVAGLIAASAFNGIGGRGVAPRASLMGTNWLESQDLAYWVASHGFIADLDEYGNYYHSLDAQVINMSYGYLPPMPVAFAADEHEVIEEVMQFATEFNHLGLGLSYIKAAGNDFFGLGLGALAFGYPLAGVDDEYGMLGDSDEELEPELALLLWARGVDPRLGAVNINLEPEIASFYSTTVGALSADANRPRASYSSTGSALWVSAFGGEEGVDEPAMITTDLTGCDRGYASESDENLVFNINALEEFPNPGCDFVSDFNGTSSAAPLVSGVVALIKQANPSLNWREVRHILAATARQVDTDFEAIEIETGREGQTFVAEDAWVENAAGYHFHNWYGFGLVDASAAVDMAINFAAEQRFAELQAVVAAFEPEQQELLEPVAWHRAQQQGDEELLPILPELPEALAWLEDDGQALSLTVDVGDDLFVEGVQLHFTMLHDRASDLAIRLRSPAGTESLILNPRTLIVGEALLDDYLEPWGSYFLDTRLLTNAFYGESSQGKWQVRFYDTNGGDFEFLAWGASLQDLDEDSDFDDLEFGDFLVSIPNPEEPAMLFDAQLIVYGHEKE